MLTISEMDREMPSSSPIGEPRRVASVIIIVVVVVVVVVVDFTSASKAQMCRLYYTM